MENYIVINGKKAELTEEQLKILGIKEPKINAFDRRKEGETYYFINTQGEVENTHENSYHWDNDVYNIANYCADKTLMKQRSLYETLNRLLWRFSMEHDGDKINWSDRNSAKYGIYYDHASKSFRINAYWVTNFNITYFHTKEIAERAIEEIVKPFITEHPEFR